jgi:hypothetical protein
VSEPLEDEGSWLLLALVHSPRHDVVAVGSTIVVANCGHRCWISPDGVFMQEKNGSYTVCMACGSELVTDPPEDARIFYPANALDDIERVAGVAEADQARAFIRNLGGKPWPG